MKKVPKLSRGGNTLRRQRRGSSLKRKTRHERKKEGKSARNQTGEGRKGKGVYDGRRKKKKKKRVWELECSKKEERVRIRAEVSFGRKGLGGKGGEYRGERGRNIVCQRGRGGKII